MSLTQPLTRTKNDLPPPTPSLSSSLVKTRVDDSFVDPINIQHKTRLSLVEFIKNNYMVGTEKNIIASEEIYSLCQVYYKNSPPHLTYISSKFHFTQKFKKSWSLVFPNHELITDSIRDPNNKNKRGIACIIKKRVRSPSPIKSTCVLKA